MNRLLKVLGVALLASSAVFASDSGKEECREEGQTYVPSSIYAPEGAEPEQPGVGVLDQQPAVADAAIAGQVAAVPVPTYTRIEDTDTKVLLGCLETGDITPYLEHIKACIKTKLGGCVDNLISYNGNFLSYNVRVAGYASASSASYSGIHTVLYDHSRDAFKAFVYANLDSLDLLGGVPVPADARLSSISQYVMAVNAVIAKEMTAFIDSLLGYNGDFLSSEINLYTYSMHTVPYNHSRDAFKEALTNIIDPTRTAMLTYLRESGIEEAMVKTSVPYVMKLRNTDTEQLLMGVSNGNIDQYLEHVKCPLVASLNAYIDGLSTASDNFLDDSVATGGVMQPMASTSNAFKAALEVHLAGLNLRGRVPVPADIRLKSITRFVGAIDAEIIQSVSTYIDTLKPSNDGNFLGAGAAIGGAGQPTDRTRDAFKAALGNVIFD